MGPTAELQRKSTADAIADVLRGEIVAGRIAGGDQLKQTEIAMRFGASVVPVREAFQRLIADGLAVLHHNRGVTVTPATIDDFIDIAELRALLEPQALEKSAPHLTEADFKHAEATLRRAAASVEPAERAGLHWDFHRTLYARCGRPRLIAEIGSLYVSINRYLLPMWSAVGLSPDWDESHLDIVVALREGKVKKAKRLVVDQIIEAQERIVAELKSRR
jgi:DNA-binding GntR family transcriptional regulator